MNENLQKKVEDLFRRGDSLEIEAFKKGRQGNSNFSPTKEAKEAYVLGIETFLDEHKINVSAKEISNPFTYKGFILAYYRKLGPDEEVREKASKQVLNILCTYSGLVQNAEAKQREQQFMKGLNAAEEYFKRKEVDDFKTSLQEIKFPGVEKLPQKIVNNLYDFYNFILSKMPEQNSEIVSFFEEKISDSLRRAKIKVSKEDSIQHLDKALFLIYWLAADAPKLRLEFDRLDRDVWVDQYRIASLEILKKEKG